MAKYFGTFSCGHEGYVNVIGPGKDRQWKIDRAFSNMCDECYKKHLEEERNRKNEEALEKAKDMDLPSLEGTEKQVAWANTLRQEFIDKFENCIDYIKSGENAMQRTKIRKMFKIKKSEVGGTKEAVTDAIIDNLYKFQDLILSNNKATFFINKRNTSINDLIEENAEYIINKESIENEKELRTTIINETTVEPDEIKFEGVVEIVANIEEVYAIYEMNDSFRKIVKDLGYSWEKNKWSRKINTTTGSYVDRAAELANKLLNEGFRVAIPEINIKEKAVDGTYEKECKRWIYENKDTNKLSIKWRGYDENLYSVSKKIKGAKWDKSSMLVHVQNYEQVEEFADMYGFKFTEAALELINQYKKELSSIEKVNAAEVEKVKEKNGLEDILNSSREVLDDLVEED